jgi:cephalosporin-C deacetylase-like acetyl esterase
MFLFTKDFYFNANIDKFYDASGQLPNYLKKLADTYFCKEEKEKKDIKTIEDIENRKKKVKEFFLSSIGGLDFEKSPLNPIITGEIKGEGYTIKKVIFESLPNFYVSSNLYIPDNREGLLPAILFTSGHSVIAKAAPFYQKAAIESVLNGFVVLSVDPVGQGERLQYTEINDIYPNEFSSTREHSYVGIQCCLTGSSLTKYMTWDLIRGVDYLESLDFVDKTKIGMFGTSGGGLQTTFMMMCDERISVAAPTCYITSREEYMKTGQSQDQEQIIIDSIEKGLNYDDYITAFAPKPVLINCALYDYFCIEGAVKTYERSKRLYEIYNAEDKIEIGISKLRHGLENDLRKAAIGFIKKHTLNEPLKQGIELESKLLDLETLNCTKTGYIALDYPSSKSVFDLNKEHFKKIKYKDTDNLDDLKNRIKRVLNFPQDIDKRAPIIYPRIIREYTINNIFMQKIFFFSEDDICVTGVFMKKDSCDNNHCTIFVSEDSTNEIIEKQTLLYNLLEKGAVFVFDPRGIGAVTSRKVKPDIGTSHYGIISDNERKLNCDAMMLGTSLCALRVFDILRAYDYIKGRDDCETISFAGDGIGVLYTLLANALLEKPVKIYTSNEIESFENMVSTKYYTTSPKYNIPGILCELDIPLLKKVLNAQELSE